MGQSPLLGGVAMSFLPSAGLGSRSAFLCGQSQTAQAIKAHLRLNDTKTRIFSTLAWKRINKKLTVRSRIVCRPLRSETDRTGHQSRQWPSDAKTRIFSTLAWKRINKKLTVKSRIVCRPSAIILRAHTLESPFLKKKVLRNEENP